MLIITPDADVRAACRRIVEECVRSGRAFLLPHIKDQTITEWPAWVLEEAEFFVSRIIHNIRDTMRMGGFAVKIPYDDADDKLKDAGFDDAVLDVLGDMGYTVVFDYAQHEDGKRWLVISWCNPSGLTLLRE